MKVYYSDDATADATASVIDISKGGMYVQDGHAPEVKGYLADSLDTEDISKVIWVEGRVVRETKTGIGVMFTNTDEKRLDNLLISEGALPDIPERLKGKTQVMNTLADQQSNIELIRMNVSEMIARCINDIHKMVTSSGLHMRDVGVGIEMYKTSSGSDIIELRMRHK